MRSFPPLKRWTRVWKLGPWLFVDSDSYSFKIYADLRKGFLELFFQAAYVFEAIVGSISFHINCTFEVMIR